MNVHEKIKTLLISNSIRYRYFPVKFAKFLETPILKKISKPLLLVFKMILDPLHASRLFDVANVVRRCRIDQDMKLVGQASTK